MVTLPGAWCSRVSTGTGRPSVSILWLGEVESWICNFYLSVAACTIIWADPSLRYTSMLLGRYATNQPTNKPHSPQCHTVFSPMLLLSSPFISENCTLLGSARRAVCRMVSPSVLLMVMVLSSLPSANRPSALHAPQVIFLVCLPMMGIFLIASTYAYDFPFQNIHTTITK